MEVVEVYKYMDKFTLIYKDGKIVNPIPKNKKVTVYCEDGNEKGFVFNTTPYDMGIT